MASTRPPARKPDPKAADGKPSRWTSRGALVAVAAGILLLKQFLPFSSVVFYPFTLLSNWVHEMGHGVAAMLVGQTFDHLQIDLDASALAVINANESFYSSPAGAFVAAAGLLAPPFVGASMLAMARGPKRVRVILGVLSLALFVSLAAWVRSVVGWIAVCVMVSLLIWINLKWSEKRRMAVAKFLGVLFALDTFGRIGSLFTETLGNGPSDIARVAKGFGGHYMLWGVLFTAISLGLVVLGVWASWRQPKPKADKPLRVKVPAKPEASLEAAKTEAEEPEPAKPEPAQQRAAT